MHHYSYIGHYISNIPDISKSEIDFKEVKKQQQQQNNIFNILLEWSLHSNGINFIKFSPTKVETLMARATTFYIPNIQDNSTFEIDLKGAKNGKYF